ncbi:MAG TPA: sugar phosphorylase, partial [Chloroflexi bacterium]|nr:sugar phosphorylase [Chloroflexota bacterium]
RAPALQARIERMAVDFHHHRRPPGPFTAERLTERDVVLITYADQVTEPGRPPLRTLAEVLETYIRGVVTGVHLLPFFPSSSDDGFSVMDYTMVDPDLGDWEDVERIGQGFRLMFDAVINHISAQSDWFQRFLASDPAFSDFFIVVEPGAATSTDLSRVVRPRALPLLTPVQTASGERLVWTTFSADQIDLNYAHPEVLLQVIETLLLYVEKGAEIIRLDAIAYLWKEIGTSCIHLEETHRVVKLLRAALDIAAPHVILITETNVPHAENVSYFGDGADEAQMVYQFPLPPLTLHAITTGDASRLSRWAAGLSTPSESTTFFNFLASHDGIGVRPAEGILTPAEMQALVERTVAHGGYVSCKTNPDGSESVYELNISYFDALSNPTGGEPLELQVRRFLASQAIMLSLAGVPGVYVHSLFGSRSDRSGVAQTGRRRTINRQKFQRDELAPALADPTSLRHRVFYPYLDLIRKRTTQRAFHPNGPQHVLDVHPALFVLLRTAPDGRTPVLCIINVSDAPQRSAFDARAVELSGEHVTDIVSGATFPVEPGGNLTVEVAPYQVLWLTEVDT